MPTSLLEALFPEKDHVFRGVIARAALEPFIKKSHLKDESIHKFVVRRFGSHVAENLISALVHGIFAGDSRNLSVKSCFPFLWEMEQKYGSVILGLLISAIRNQPEVFDATFSPESIEFIKSIKKNSVYAFKNGLETLTNALEQDLLQNYPNVTVLKNQAVDQIRLVNNDGFPSIASASKLKNSPESSKVLVTTRHGKEFVADHVISCLPSATLHKLLPETSNISRLLAYNPAVNVVVVNLAYKSQTLSAQSILPVQGFGYLIPQTQSSNILGVIFDSIAIPDKNDPSLTRITCMMGGHQFHKVFGKETSPDSVSPENCLKLALEAVAQDLGITEKPYASLVTVQKQCITQYLVGHQERLREIHEGLLREFDGRLSVAGSSYLGVGVNDCVISARRVVNGIMKGGAVTGLESIM